MLDGVERRRFLVDPSGEDPAPLLVAALHVDLDESARELFLLPRSGCLASLQPDEQVLPASRLAGPERNVADQAIALVEEADDGDPVGHRSDSGLGIGRSRSRRRLVRAGVVTLVPLSASGEEGGKPDRQRRSAHRFYSGIQGW
jgi:hypothetical protein